MIINKKNHVPIKTKLPLATKCFNVFEYNIKGLYSSAYRLPDLLYPA